MDVEGIASSLSWQDFEGFVAEILRENGFRVSNNVRFKTGGWHEIDIVAVRGDRMLCVDCKRWKGGRSKKRAVAKAAKEQEARLTEFLKYVGEAPNAGVDVGLSKSVTNFNAMIITLMQEDIIKEEDTFVVPVYKFNSFILEMEKYL